MKPAFTSLKLEDIKELQELVIDNVEAIELGLRLLDSRVLLGGATIEMLALDSRDVLTLVALGFQADDEMLLRALEAYSWCLEYPDALRRLYPDVRPAPTEPPRVIFIAERVPDAFLRKIKHLKFHRADCLEFRFGLQFNPVEEMRGPDGRRASDPPPAPRAPRAAPNPATRAPRPEPPVAKPAPKLEPVTTARVEEPPRAPLAHESPRAVEDVQDQVLEQLRATSTPAPGWIAKATKMADEVEDGMVRGVRDYLQREFPTAVIYDFYAHDRGVQMFHLQDSHGALVHSAAVAEDLLAGASESQLRAFLEKHKLARVLRQAGSAGVSVTKSGLKIERR